MDSQDKNAWPSQVDLSIAGPGIPVKLTYGPAGGPTPRKGAVKMNHAIRRLRGASSDETASSHIQKQEESAAAFRSRSPDRRRVDQWQPLRSYRAAAAHGRAYASRARQNRRRLPTWTQGGLGQTVRTAFLICTENLQTGSPRPLSPAFQALLPNVPQMFAHREHLSDSRPPDVGPEFISPRAAG